MILKFCPFQLHLCATLQFYRSDYVVSFPLFNNDLLKSNHIFILASSFSTGCIIFLRNLKLVYLIVSSFVEPGSASRKVDESVSKRTATHWPFHAVAVWGLIIDRALSGAKPLHWNFLMSQVNLVVVAAAPPVVYSLNCSRSGSSALDHWLYWLKWCRGVGPAGAVKFGCDSLFVFIQSSKTRLEKSSTFFVKH